MAKPWEKYQKAKPWEKYAQPDIRAVAPAYPIYNYIAPKIPGALNAIDAVTGAPVRAAISELGKENLGHPLTAAWNQFKSFDSSKAPSPHDLAVQAGLSAEPLNSPALRKAASVVPLLQPITKLNLSPADLASLPIAVATDPTTWAGPIWGLLKKGTGLRGPAEALKDVAAKFSYKSLSPIKSMAVKDIANKEYLEIGKTLLEKGVTGRLPKSAEKQLEIISDLMSKTGKSYDQQLESLNSYMQANNLPGVDKAKIAKKLESSLIQEAQIPSVAKRNEQYSEMINEFANNGEPTLSISQIERNVKRPAQAEVNYNALKAEPDQVTENFYRQLGKASKEEIENLAKQNANKAGISFEEFMKNKRDYGALANAQNYALGSAGRDLAGKHALSKSSLFNTYGNQLLATGADLASEGLTGTGAFLRYLALANEAKQAMNPYKGLK